MNWPIRAAQSYVSDTTNTSISLLRRVAAFIPMLLLAACGGGGGGGGGSSIPPFTLYWSVAIADLNGDGLPDVATSYSYVDGPPPHRGYVAIYFQDQTRPGIFLPAKTYPVGNDPASIAIGDLDGDGKADIVTANSILATSGAGASTVSVLLQNTAKPGEFLPAVSYATGTNPVSVAIGDLNGDGKADLAVADNFGLSLLFQNPIAPGTFLPRVAIAGAASSVAIADLNGDGKSDLVVTNAANVLVLLQDPSTAGTFLAAASYGAGAQPIYAAIRDLNGDGKPDIAVANLGSPTDPTTASVSILRQNPAAPGSFLAAVTYATNLRSQSVTIADLNGDGNADIAVANTGTLAGVCPPDCGSRGTGISVLLQNPAAAGQFLPATNYAASDYVYSVMIGDMNGDHKGDLVFAQGDGVLIQFQDTAHPGQFLAAVRLPN